jgi:hypothetical protein
MFRTFFGRHQVYTAFLTFAFSSGLLVLPTLANVGRPHRPEKMGNVKRKKSCILQYHVYTYQNRFIRSPAVAISTDEPEGETLINAPQGYKRA